MPRLFPFAAVALALLVAGCSEKLAFFPAFASREDSAIGTLPSNSPQAPAVLGGRHVEPSTPAPGGKEPPIGVSVAQAFYADERLLIKVRLQTKASLSSDDIVVSIVGLREGQVLEKHHRRIGEMLSHAALAKGESVLVPFELEGRELSEYQIQARWGEDAKEQLVEQHPENSAKSITEHTTAKAEVNSSAPSGGDPTGGDLTSGAQSSGHDVPRAFASEQALTEDVPIITPSKNGNAKNDDGARAAMKIETEAPQAGAGDLELRDVELETDSSKCSSEPCDLHYVVRARAVNESTESIASIQLAVGFAWAEANTLPKPPARGAPKQAREELVDLSKVVLKPGESRKLKVRVNRGVPQVPGGAFLPYIRIVRAERGAS